MSRSKYGVSNIEYYDCDYRYDIRGDDGHKLRERDIRRREKQRAEDDTFAQHLGFKSMTELREHVGTYDGPL